MSDPRSPPPTSDREYLTRRAAELAAASVALVERAMREVTQSILDRVRSEATRQRSRVIRAGLAGRTG